MSTKPNTKEYVYSYTKVGKHIRLYKTPARLHESRRYDGEVIVSKGVWKLLRLFTGDNTLLSLRERKYRG